ncbi:hypothetical protein [Dryocola clanedunensis]
MIKKSIILAAVLAAVTTSAFAAETAPQRTNPCEGKAAGEKVTVTNKDGKEATITCLDIHKKDK